MSLARRHQMAVLAAQLGAAGAELARQTGVFTPPPADAGGGGVYTAGAAPANDNAPPLAAAVQRAQAEILLQLDADRRRLKMIQSVERKIAAKSEMIPAYGPWLDGLLGAAAETGRGVQDEVLATMMIWRLDVGDFEGALPLIEYVLRYDLALPERFERQPAVLIVEELAEGALKRLAAGQPAPLAVMQAVDALTEDADMPDEVSAKLRKAFGLEWARVAADETDARHGDVAGFRRAAREQALAFLRRALELDARCGVKKSIEALERELKKDADPVAPTKDAT